MANQLLQCPKRVQAACAPYVVLGRAGVLELSSPVIELNFTAFEPL